MKIKTVTRDGVTVVEISGNVDANTVRCFRQVRNTEFGGLKVQTLAGGL